MTDLLALPEELVLSVFSFLSPPDLGFVASTCHDLGRLSGDDSLWFDLFQETKRKHLLESLPFTSTSHLPCNKTEESRKEQLRWKERFRETFHVKPGVADKVILVLDNKTCEEGKDLTGELIVTVASEKRNCNGIFVRINAIKKSYAIVGRSVNMNTRALGEFNFPVYGTDSWEARYQNNFTLRRGIYHVPFSFPVPSKGRRGEALPLSRASKGRGYQFQVEYTATGLLFVNKGPSPIQSGPQVITMLPRSQEQQQRPALQEGTASTTDTLRTPQGPIRKVLQKNFLLGGSAIIGVSLDKQSFTRGEEVNVLVDIDNNSSYSVNSLNVSFNEWSVYRSGGQSLTKGCKSLPLKVSRGSQQLSVPFTLEWEDSPKQPEQPVKRGYYMQVSLDIPYAYNPELLIPITLLQPYPH